MWNWRVGRQMLASGMQDERRGLWPRPGAQLSMAQGYCCGATWFAAFVAALQERQFRRRDFDLCLTVLPVTYLGGFRTPGSWVTKR